MRKVVSVIGLLGAIGLSSFASQAADIKLNTQHLNRMGIEVIHTEPGEIEGYVRAITNQGMFYVSKDGERLLNGNVFDITAGQPENLSEKAFSQVRKDMLSTAKDDALVYAAQNEKYQVTVFTDTTCGYCQRLHENMGSYLDKGITIKYLAFPRGGMNSKGAQQLQTVWCAEDKKAALSGFFDDEHPSGETRCANPVSDHYELGKSFGVTGTPAIILPNGRLIPGAVPASRLLQELRKSESQ